MFTWNNHNVYVLKGIQYKYYYNNDLCSIFKKMESFGFCQLYLAMLLRRNLFQINFVQKKGNLIQKVKKNVQNTNTSISHI